MASGPRPPAQRLILLLVALVILPGLGLGWYGARAVMLEERVAASDLRQQADELGAVLVAEFESAANKTLARLDVAAGLEDPRWDLDPAAAAEGLRTQEVRHRAVIVLAGDGTLLVPSPPAPRSASPLPPCAPAGASDPLAAIDAALLDGAPGQGKASLRLARAQCLSTLSRLNAAIDEVRALATTDPHAVGPDGLPITFTALFHEASWRQRGGDVGLAASATLRLLRALDIDWPGTGTAEAALAARVEGWVADGRLLDATPPSERSAFEAARDAVGRRLEAQQDLLQALALLPVVTEAEAASQDDPAFRWLPLQAGDRAMLLAVAHRRSAPAARRIAVLYDGSALRADFDTVLRTASQVNPRLSIGAGSGPLPDGALVTRALSPLLPGERLAIGAGVDPLRAERAAQRQSIRLGMVGSLVLLIFAGLATVGRAVAREIEIARLKSDFVSNVSHELRTPLTTIRIMAEMLSLGAVPSLEKQQEYYRNIVSEAERLTRLINNVLDFARIEEGRKKFTMGMGDLADTIFEVERITGDYIRSEGFELQTDVAPDLPPTAFDRDAMIQALINLMSNAVKYSRDDKRITLGARQDGERIVLWVRDHGPGIDSKDIPHLFEKFYRGGDALTREVGGTGLGLSIVAHIVEAHEGQVRVESSLGGGATFLIELPVRTLPSPKKPPARRPHGTEVRP